MREISSDDTEVLAYWKEAMPIEHARLHRRLLPKSIKLPTRTVEDSELIQFYNGLIPKKITSLMRRVSGLGFPVLDIRHLSEQLKGKSDNLELVDIELISYYNYADFPLIGVGPALDIVTKGSLFGWTRGYWKEYTKCMDKRDLNGQPREPAQAE